MSDPFMGEIRMVGFNFAPRGWATCQGQIMAIQQNSALFALLGTTYGGNGQTTFGLPNFSGRSPVGQGTGPGLAPITIGEVAGAESVTLNVTQMPIHQPVAQFTGQASAVSLTGSSVDVATGTPGAMAVPTAGATVYLSNTTARSGPTAVTINGLFTSTAPDATKASLGGVHGQGSVIPQGTVTVSPVGGSQPIGIRNPYLGTNFIIALEGIFPSRN
ncbi:tail fiber protein [Pseudomonas sp. MDMC216]|jgi:microcystin-dependent protein|nr:MULTISPECIES: tail fiber protein [Pseudomonas]KJU76163.1 tail protein [Pseudomonas oleovorans]ERH54060.1 tail protein [Pseudomonas chengduensis]MBG0843603.1 phage tail protein [Pseudomonas chengduensis]MDH1557615.1 tail fiber protein [Pseudomonas chengduensis]MDH1622310.1 tail fiber protein [Pseudomonas chengduensis]